MAFRNGQWVKFKGKVHGAHTASDGKVVGIFQKGGVDGLGQSAPDRIMVVDGMGNNIPAIKDGALVNVSVEPEKAEGLVPVLDVADIPAARRATMREGFQLKA